MRTPASVKTLEDLGRVPLSKSFFMLGWQSTGNKGSVLDYFSDSNRQTFAKIKLPTLLKPATRATLEDSNAQERRSMRLFTIW